MPSLPTRIGAGLAHPLHDGAATRAMEQALVLQLLPHALMERAGRAIARLARAVAPHARQVWIAAGPGNNGGDGLQAAASLQAAGIEVFVTLCGDGARARPADAQAALAAARTAGVQLVDAPPAGLTPDDLCIDALLGIGRTTQPADAKRASPAAPWLLAALQWLRQSPAPVLAVDVPTGLQADTGVVDPELIAACDGPASAGGLFDCKFTLSLLTLKPGLFTAAGRDAAGEIWFDNLQDASAVSAASSASPASPGSSASRASKPADVDAAAPSAEKKALRTDGAVAWLNAAPAQPTRPQASHKGMFGDVAVIGGEGIARRGMGMSGAAVLAATAAASNGAGRVLLALLNDDIAGNAISPPAEIMLRRPDVLDLAKSTVVCGCGGGEAVAPVLARVLREARALVLDADALNAVSEDEELQQLLASRNGPTILTPHPLEAARLLGWDDAHRVQADRLAAARALVERYRCVVVVKGSGSIVAGPGRLPAINPTGNGRLATAGTGDVLAGMAGAALAANPSDAFAAAAAAVYHHGALADAWPADRPLTAWALARRC